MEREADSRQSATAAPSTFSLNAVATAIVILISALIGWGVSMIPDKPDVQLIAGLTAGIMSAAFLCTSANTGDTRSATVIRATSWTFFVVALLVSAGMALWCENYKMYILANGLWLAIFAAIAYRVASSGQ